MEEAALARAEEECLADAEIRARRREREAERRAEMDRRFVGSFAARVRELYPGCPEGTERAIAEHACLKYSGRVGRSAAAKALDEEAVRLAVIAQREAFLSPEEIAAYRELMGLTTTEDVPPEKPQPRTDRFTGRFILLTDNGSFSSASDFAAVVKAYHLGTIIGTETGGAATTFGDVIYETLPYSGLSVSISYTKFWGPKSEPGDMTHGIIPDLIATGSVLEQYRGAKDPVLALALHEAREGRQHPAQLHPCQD